MRFLRVSTTFDVFEESSAASDSSRTINGDCLAMERKRAIYASVFSPPLNSFSGLRAYAFLGGQQK